MGKSRNHFNEDSSKYNFDRSRSKRNRHNDSNWTDPLEDPEDYDQMDYEDSDYRRNRR